MLPTFQREFLHGAIACAAVAMVAWVPAACQTGSALPPGSADIRLADGRKSVSVSMTGLIHVELLGHDGTGYDWRLAAYDRGKIEPVGTPSVTPLDPGVRGGRTITTFQFRPLLAGRSTLVFEYVRPWASDPPGKVAMVEVNAGGGA